MAFTVVILHCLGDCGKQVPDAGTLLCNSLTLNRFPAKLGTGSSDDLYAFIYFLVCLASCLSLFSRTDGPACGWTGVCIHQMSGSV